MATDVAFLYPATQLIKMQKKYGKAPLYFYEFAHMSQSHRSYVVAFGAPSPDYGESACRKVPAGKTCVLTACRSF